MLIHALLHVHVQYVLCLPIITIQATLERFKQTSKHSHTSRSGTRMYSHQHKEKLASTKQPSTFGGRLLYSEEGESRLLENGDEGDTDAESPPSATPLSDLPASIRDSTHKRVKVRKRRSRISPKLSTSDDEGLTGQHARQQQWTHTHKFKLGRSQRVQPMPLLATSGRQSRAIAQCVHREFAWMDPPQGVQLMSIQSVQPILQPQSLRPPPPHYMLPPQLSLPSPPTGHHSPTPTPDYTLLSSTNRQMHAHHATAPTPHSASTQHIVRDVGSDEEGGAVLSGVDSVDGGVVRVKPGSHLLKSEGDLTRECSITGGGGKSRVGGNNRSITKQPPVTEQPKSVTSEKHASHPAATDDGEGGTKGETHPPLRDSEHPHREEDSGLSLQGMLQQVTWERNTINRHKVTIVMHLIVAHKNKGTNLDLCCLTIFLSSLIRLFKYNRNKGESKKSTSILRKKMSECQSSHTMEVHLLHALMSTNMFTEVVNMSMNNTSVPSSLHLSIHMCVRNMFTCKKHDAAECYI